MVSYAKPIEVSQLVEILTRTFAASATAEDRASA